MRPPSPRWTKVGAEPDEPRSGARIRALGFSGALGAGMAGTGAKIVHEAAQHWHPGTGKYTGRAILPATMVGLGAGISDKKEELHRAAGNILTRAQNAVSRDEDTRRGVAGVSRAAMMPGGASSIGKEGAVRVDPGWEVGEFDGLDAIGAVLFGGYGDYKRAAAEQLSVLGRPVGADAARTSSISPGPSRTVFPQRMTLLSGMNRP